MFDKIWNLFKEEWSEVKAAWKSVIAIIIVFLTVGWTAASMFYAERINILNDRIAAQAERLGINRPDKSTLSKLTNKELKQAVEEFIPKLKTFADQAAKSKPKSRWEEAMQQTNGKTDDERRKIYQSIQQAEFNESVAWHDQVETAYQRDFRPNATLLRDEILSRIPPPPGQRRLMYEGLVGPSPLEDIITDLQKLATLLQERQN